MAGVRCCFHFISYRSNRALYLYYITIYLIIDRKKQGFRAPIGEWIKKDEDYFYESIKEFNSLVNLFSERELKKVLQGNDFQKKWYLVNLSRWHMTRVAN